MLELVGQVQAAGRHGIANELRYRARACARVAFREAALVEDRERVFRTDDESLPGVVRERARGLGVGPMRLRDG